MDLIVLHYISIPPGIFGGGRVIDFFLGRLDPRFHPFCRIIAGLRVSAHFFIERDGVVHQFVDTDDTAWHAGESSFAGIEDCNAFSVGIELEGDEHHPFTGSQYKALGALCSALMRRYPEIRTDRIVGHCHVAPGRKTDPGPMFDWERFHDDLARSLEPRSSGVQ